MQQNNNCFMAISSKNSNRTFSIASRITTITKIIAIEDFSISFEIIHMSFEKTNNYRFALSIFYYFRYFDSIHFIHCPSILIPQFLLILDHQYLAPIFQN